MVEYNKYRKKRATRTRRIKEALQLHEDMAPDIIQGTHIACEAYYRAINDFHGSSLKIPADVRKHRSFKQFHRLYLWCKLYGLNPVDYITATVPMVISRTSVCAPRNLVSAEIRGLYLNSSNAETCRPMEMAGMCLKQLKKFMACGASKKDVLMSPSYAFPAWFRLIASNVDPDIASNFLEAASKEYNDSPLVKELVDNTCQKLSTSIQLFSQQMTSN